MRQLAYFLSAICMLLATSCDKETVKGNSAVKSNNATLTGNWKLVQSLADPGDGSGTWQPVATSTSLAFNADGTTNGSTFPNYIAYTLSATTDITFSQADKTTQNYRFTISHDTLSISPDGPIRCTEACGIRFVKTN